MPGDPNDPEDGVEAGIYRLAYDEALRVLADQVATLDRVRTRAAGILSLAIIAGTFLADVILSETDPRRGLLFWNGIEVAGIGYAAMLGLSISIVRPRSGWKWNMSPRGIIEGYADTAPPATLEETHRQLALFHDNNINSNQAILDALHTQFVWLLVGMVVGIAGLVVAAASV